MLVCADDDGNIVNMIETNTSNEISSSLQTEEPDTECDHDRQTWLVDDYSGRFVFVDRDSKDWKTPHQI
jgi:hypothetical protein